ncbi:hypothetical protein R1flu_003157 [Riccia fluitans]|uniref:Uncharacterized protein n=1 Tax=Riccia fluitans TaxID=41844 RepID=A0ABD1YBL2_9MARC
MAEAIVVVGNLIPQLAIHVQQLIVYLMAVREIKIHNNLKVEEITNFADSLQTNLRLVKSKLPEEVSGKALLNKIYSRPFSRCRFTAYGTEEGKRAYERMPG